MRPLHAFSAAIGLLAASALPASAATIDFSTAPQGFVTYSQDGATLSNVANSTNTMSNGPNGTRSWLADGSPRPEFRADFSGSGATSVSVDLGDFNRDADTLFLEIFDSADVLLDSVTLLIGGADETMHTLSLGGVGIAYALFGGRAPSADGNSIYADNITFTLGGAVPEPATWAMMIAGFGLVGGAMRRRERTIARLA